MSNRPTPETDGLCRAHQDDSIDDWEKYRKTIVFARKLERERDDYKWQLHIAKGEIAEARKMERAWKKEETK